MYKPIRSAELISGGNVIKQGEHFALTFQLFDVDGQTVDVTGKTIAVKIANKTGVVLDATATAETEGKISFSVNQDIGHGEMRVEIKVSDGASLLQKYPADGWIELRITPSHDDLGFGGVNTVTVEMLKNDLTQMQTDYETIVDDKLLSIQTQLNQTVIEGDSSVEAAQARVDLENFAYETLKERLDMENTELKTQIANIGTGSSNAADISIADADGLFVSDKVEGALKEAITAANDAKSQANDIKGKWANVVGSPLLAADTSTVLESKTQFIKNDLANSLTVKGVSSVGTETLNALADKVKTLSMGKRTASGTVTSSATTQSFQYVGNSTVFRPTVTVTGLSFKPSMVYLVYTNGATSNFMIYEEIAGQAYPKTVKLAQVNDTTTSGASYHFKGDVAPVSVTNGGFTLPVSTASVVYKWIAYE